MKKLFVGLFTSMLLLCGVTASASVGNLITDGGFESGTITTDSTWKAPGKNCWYSYSYAKIETDNVASGSNAVYMEYHSKGMGAVAQRIAVEEGKTYVLSAKTKCDGENGSLQICNGTAEWPLSGNTLALTAIPKSISYENNETVGGYVTTSLIWTAEKSQDIVIYIYSSAQTCYVDDVELYEINDTEKFEYENDTALKYSDAVGFVAEISTDKTINSLTWYLKKTGGEYKELCKGNLPTITSEGNVKVGLVVYDMPDGVSKEEISAGYTAE